MLRAGDAGRIAFQQVYLRSAHHGDHGDLPGRVLHYDHRQETSLDLRTRGAYRHNLFRAPLLLLHPWDEGQFRVTEHPAGLRHNGHVPVFERQGELRGDIPHLHRTAVHRYPVQPL